LALVDPIGEEVNHVADNFTIVVAFFGGAMGFRITLGVNATHEAPVILP